MSTVKTIIYQKSFVIGPYLQEKIGVEVELREDDDHDKTFEQAKALVEKWGSMQLTDAKTIHWPIPSTGTMPHVQPMPSIDRKAIDELEKKIDEATSIDELLQMRTEILYYGLIKSYDNKLKVLSK